jgi:hypothetical protein
MARFNTALTSSVISGTATIGTPYSGAFTEFTGTAPYTVTLPSPTLFPGVNQTFYNATSGQVTLSVSGATFSGTGGTGSATFVLNAGNVVSIFSDGTNYIVISEDGSPLTATTGSFSGNVTINGGTATLSVTNQTVTINPTGTSTIDNVNIGTTTRGSGAFNTLTANQAVTFTANTASSGTGTGSLVVTGGVGVSGNINSGATVSGVNLAGTISTAAQPNITSVGNLSTTGLAVNTTAIVTSGTNNVGINTASPKTNGATFGTLTLNGSSGGAIQFATNDVSIAQIYNDANALFINPSSGKTLSLQNNGTTAVSVGAASVAVTGTLTNTTGATFATSSGNVGVNTTSPQGKLTVSASGAEGIEFFPAASSGVNSTQHYNRSGSAYVRNRTVALDYTFNLSGAGADAMILNSSGNLGIATASPAYKLHVAGTSGTDDPRLTAISATVAATAQDVFVYDTRKDSDRGAWRKRTQHTSWYNETLNTATRGSRKEFPAVAVIVATSTTVTIYDGDDPTMPMWMVFNVTNSTWLKHSSGTGCSCVTAMNGQMVTGGDGAAGRVSVVKFIADSGYVSEPSYNYVHFLISTRNTSPVGPASGSIFIVNIQVVSVAITVLPGAFIDPLTGLPTPTIAVGTAGGATIINPKLAIGYINLLTSQGTQSKVAFTPAGGFISSGGGGYAYYFYGWYSVPVYATNIADYNITDGSWSSTAIRRQGSNGNSVLYPIVGTNYGHANSESSGISTTSKLMLVALPTASGYNITTAPGYSMVSYVTTKYNTGWMVGNIQGAFLSDSTVETITGSELVSNGTFTSNVTGWTLSPTMVGGTSTLTSVSGQARLFIAAAGSSYWCWTPISVVAAKQYVVRFDIISTTSTAYVRIGYGTEGSFDLLNINGVGVGTGQVRYITATTTGTAYVNIGETSGNNTLVFDNVSVTLADSDRSLNGSGLQIYGTLTKALVNTNSDLVAYSGWSTSNYLYQPYNSLMEPGTGEYSVSLWIYTATIANANLVNRSNLDADESMRVYLNSAGQIYFDYGGGSEYAQSTVPTVTASQWTHILCTAKAGRLGRIYINGQETAYSYQVKAPTPFLTNSHPFTVGQHIAYGTPFNGSIAMVRYSLTAPSNAQVLKMYNDEKELFQTGAKACLYGTSDVVTALAYDDTAKLVHVGTSSGRSILQNLRRIDNTATAVSAAISVSNSLVAEQ